MRKPLSAPTAIVAITATMMAAATAVSLSRAAAPASAAPSIGVPPGAGARTVLLITGERFAVIPGPAEPSTAGTSTRVLEQLSAGRGPGHGLFSLDLAGAQYEVPYYALPYLDHGLDPALFRLSSLLGGDAVDRVPVVIRFSGRMPALPGIRVTGHVDGTATGYLTASSARAFGAAVRRQFISDHARASYGADGMFGAGTTISLGGSSPGAARAAHRPDPAPRPAFKLRTLTVRASDLAGHPDTGDFVVVINIDNPFEFSDLGTALQPFDRGVAKFSVPQGHYLALAIFTGSFTALRYTVLPQFTVSGDVTVRTNERAADSEITMETPRPATMADSQLDLFLTPAAGPRLAIGLNGGGLPQWVSPTRRRPAVAKLATVTSAVLAGPKGAHQPRYIYSLSYEDRSGLIPRQLFRASAHGLATVSSRVYSTKGLSGTLGVFGVFPVQSNAVNLLCFPACGIGAGVPTARPPLLYLTANPALTWFSGLSRSIDLGFGTLFVTQEIDGRSYRAGPVSQAWNQYPLHPAPTVDLPGMAALGPFVASASRAANNLTMFLWPFTDNEPGHQGTTDLNDFGLEPGISFFRRYEFDQNGVRIASGASVASFFQAKVSPKPSVLRFRLDEIRSGGPYRLSVRTHTVWTWRSAPHPAASLPRGWLCGSSMADDFSTRCSAQDLLSLDYNVAGMRQDGSVPAGRQALTVTVSRFQPSPSTARITRVRVRVSFDNGRTWHTAPLTGRGRGHFLARYTAPETATYADLDVTAADAAGAAITQTLPRAYQITPRRAWQAACPAAPPGYARCFVLYQPRARAIPAADLGRPGSPPVPPGWGARQLEAAYRLPVGRNMHQTVAVSIPYDTPNLEKYLAIYRKQFGLPPCTTANGCFRKVNQRGSAAHLPPSGVGTGADLEATLDVSMISAACPSCHILVVEADNNLFVNLAASENTAARLGAQVISNSYGNTETAPTQALAPAYDHPGHVIVVSSGDSGFTAAQFPANLASVTAVGGTELTRAHNARRWRESVWITPFIGASGSGCSAFIAKPAWQHNTACGMRTSADVSAVADHVAVYNASYGGWLTVAGTSVSAPLIAGIYGLAGNAGSIGPGYAYRHARSLFDVTTGNNDVLIGTGGASCGFDYLCVARTGYDAPTGLGTPDGIGAF